MPPSRFARYPSKRPNAPLIFDQTRLNIETKSRSSRLPWKGQFSPNLVDYLIDTVCPESKSFLDPFCGSGTVLFEAIERGCLAIGSEVNPAAWHLATLASFSALPTKEKGEVLKRLKTLVATYGLDTSDMFHAEESQSSILTAIVNEDHPFIRKALAAVVLLGMGDKPDCTPMAIAKGAFSVTTLLNNTKSFTASGSSVLRDSRSLPLADASMEAMITSPPYINVFNYHQNYRPAAEMLGWKPLEAARSEIGSNRKHRMNRFLTVIQYAMDMAQSLNEANRVLTERAPKVIVVGRTSNVLGTPFENSSLLFELLTSSKNHGAIQTAERVFTNRFGERIYEDLLISHKAGPSIISVDDARAIGQSFLENARELVPQSNREALEEAISNASKVSPSPLLQLSVPTPFATHD